MDKKVKIKYISVGGVIIFNILAWMVLQYTAWPEMINWPYLMQHGFLPYKDIAIVHSPLLIILLKFWRELFNDDVLGLRLFSLLLQLCTGFLVFILTQKLFSKKFINALIAWIFYNVFYFYFDGNGIWFDHLLSFWSLICFSFWYLYLFIDRKDKYILLAGIFLGLSGITKQTAGWLVLSSLLGFGILYFQTRNIYYIIKRIVLYALFTLIPWGIVLVWLNSHKSLESFLFWGINFGVKVLPRSQGQILLPSINQIIATFPFLIPLILVFLDHKNRLKISFVTFWIICALAGIYPRFERFHFQPALPILAMLWVIFLDR